MQTKEERKSSGCAACPCFVLPFFLYVLFLFCFEACSIQEDGKDHTHHVGASTLIAFSKRVQYAYFTKVLGSLCCLLICTQITRRMLPFPRQSIPPSPLPKPLSNPPA